MKFIILFASFFGSLVAEEGWYPVEKKKTVAPEEVWEDSSLWPVFTKRHGEERVFLRFPSDPTYTYPASDVLQVESSQGGEIYTLIVRPDTDLFERRLAELGGQSQTFLIGYAKPEPHILDIQYYFEDRWVAERLYLGDHLYILRTASKEPLSSTHARFVTSLDIQKNPRSS